MSVVNGRKMRTCIYNKANQGVGKSIITDFISDQVLGSAIATKCDSVAPLIGNDNSTFRGKILFVFEEPPSMSVSSWQSISNSLKSLVTSDSFFCKELYHSPYECRNFCSFIMNTNNNAVKITVDDRRMVICDLSNCYAGNFEYFNKLGKICENAEVGEAFYCYCKENVDPMFDERQIPTTQNKIDLINEALPDVLMYIKERFLLNDEEEDINIKYKDFYAEYKSAMQSKGSKPKGYIETSRILNNNYMTIKKVAGGKSFFKFKRSELIKLYKSKNWLHELDELEEEEKVEGNLFIDTEEDKKPIKKPSKIIQPINELDESNELSDLKKQIEKLKNENVKLKKRSHHRTTNLKFTPKL